MTERDPSEPRTSKRRKSRRRSLRVPVDEVPRPTQAAEAVESDDGGATMEIPAFDEARATLEQIPRAGAADDASVEQELPPESEEVALESVETDALAIEEEPEPASDAKGEADTLALEASEAAVPEELLGAPRDSDEGEPLSSEATVVQEAPSEAPALAGQADAVADEAPSLELVITDDEEHEEEEDEPPPARATDPDPIPEAPKGPVVGVVVQRVVAIVSAPSSVPPPSEPEAHAADTMPGAELAIDVDEPELRIGEPDLDDLDVDIDEGERQSAPEIEPEALLDEVEPRDSAPELEDAEELLVEGERRDSAPELEDAAELLEEEARPAEESGEDGQAKKRTSKRPPPPPSNKAAKDAPPPPREAEAPKAAAPARRKKPRKAWYEELFNDDYLRTVPIPHPRVIHRQCDFIEQRFGLAQGATILDVGCGLGLHAVELTRRGYLVVGLDLSLPMLSRAADEAQDNGFKINFLHADMREMNFDGAFDAVLCYGTTFGYFDDDTNRLVVERLLKALKPRGLLLLDVVNRDYLIRNQPNLVWFEGDGCVVMEESRMNYITSRLEVKRTVILDDGRQRENVYSLRTYSLHELGQILHHQGFRVVEVTGWEAHPGVFFGSDSPKLIILAERRPAGPPTVPGKSLSGEMQAVGSEPAPPHSGEAELDEETPEAVAAEAPAVEERPEPSAAVSEALAETLEKSGELDVPEEELVPDDLEDE